MRRPVVEEKLAFALIAVCAFFVILPVVGVLALIVSRGGSAVTWEFLTAMPRSGMRAGGIFPAIVGTFYLVAGTLLVAIPVGVGAAIYLTEYSRANWLRRAVEIAIVNLAGVPSVVYGLFGMGLFVMFLKMGASISAGCLTLAIMVLPVIITSAREALVAVPKSFREVSLSLGATRWQAVRHAVLPHALPGILTGTILAVGRAAGETAPILFTVAAFYLPRLPRSLFDQAMALPYHLYVLTTQVPKVNPVLQYGTALVLVGFVFSMNCIAVIIRSRFQAKKLW